MAEDKQEWNVEMLTSIIEMLGTAKFYGKVIFTLVNGKIKCADFQQHVKFPTEKTVVLSSCNDSEQEIK